MGHEHEKMKYRIPMVLPPAYYIHAESISRALYGAANVAIIRFATARYDPTRHVLDLFVFGAVAKDELPPLSGVDWRVVDPLKEGSAFIERLLETGHRVAGTSSYITALLAQVVEKEHKANDDIDDAVREDPSILAKEDELSPA